MDKAEQVRFLEILRKGAESNLKSNNHLTPGIFIIGKDMIVIPWIYENEQEKYDILDATKLFTSQVHATAVGVVTETWMMDSENASELEMQLTQQGKLRVSQVESKVEYALVHLDVRGIGMSSYMAEIKRTSPRGDDSGDFVSLGNWEVLPMSASSNLSFFEPPTKARS